MAQIVIGGKSSLVREQALRVPKYSLTDLLLHTRREEARKLQAAEIEDNLDSQLVSTAVATFLKKNGYAQSRTKRAPNAVNKIILLNNVEAESENTSSDR